MYQVSQEEKEYLKQYDIAKYERPSVAADMAVFTVMGDKQQTSVRNKDNYRKLPEKKLKILLIKRGSYPYKGQWALPGGFCRRGEEVCDTARRELWEETQVGDAYLNLAGIFGEEGRDPRGWIISHAFLALFDGEKCKLRAGSDAWEAKWFEVEFTKEKVMEDIIEHSVKNTMEESIEHSAKNIMESPAENSMKNVTEDHVNNYIVKEEGTAHKNTIYRLQLINQDEEEPVILQAVIREEKSFRQFQVKTTYHTEEEQGFAFDHAKIITHAVLYLRQLVETDGRIVFDLMPEYFSLTELQKAFEIILGKELLTANFRRKMADYVVETDKMIEGVGHRPAKLFKRNLQSVFME